MSAPGRGAVARFGAGLLQGAILGHAEDRQRGAGRVRAEPLPPSGAEVSVLRVLRRIGPSPMGGGLARAASVRLGPCDRAS